MTNDKNIKINHTVTLNSKELLTVTAVIKVEYLSPEGVLLDTQVGKIGVKGANLFVDNLNSETGVITIKGLINSFTYYDKDSKSNFLKRIFG
ncbi:MAG: YabP/YqfC family sporulation protein [Clostridia bacterium]